MTNEQAAALEYPFTADEIEWRILRTTKDKTKGQVAAFIGGAPIVAIYSCRHIKQNR